MHPLEYKRKCIWVIRAWIENLVGWKIKFGCLKQKCYSTYQSMCYITEVLQWQHVQENIVKYWERFGFNEMLLHVRIKYFGSWHENIIKHQQISGLSSVSIWMNYFLFHALMEYIFTWNYMILRKNNFFPLKLQLVGVLIF